MEARDRVWLRRHPPRGPILGMSHRGQRISNRGRPSQIVDDSSDTGRSFQYPDPTLAQNPTFRPRVQAKAPIL